MYRSRFTTRQWQTIFAMLAAITTFALATPLHPDFTLSPATAFVLGCVNVALAVVRPGGDPGDP